MKAFLKRPTYRNREANGGNAVIEFALILPLLLMVVFGITELGRAIMTVNVLTQADIDRVSEPIGNFFKEFTKTELFKEAVEREIMLFPVSNVQDALSDSQLLDREFWKAVEHGESGEAISGWAASRSCNSLNILS